jgi:hypothetical protein
MSFLRSTGTAEMILSEIPISSFPIPWLPFTPFPMLPQVALNAFALLSLLVTVAMLGSCLAAALGAHSALGPVWDRFPAWEPAGAGRFSHSFPAVTAAAEARARASLPVAYAASLAYTGGMYGALCLAKSYIFGSRLSPQTHCHPQLARICRRPASRGGRLRWGEAS